MNISEPFVHRPVATTLLTVGIALAGVAAFKQLPVAPLPQVAFPTIQVNASLPGASPEVMAATVAMPLERALGRIAGITEITSGSSLGSTRVTLQFELSRNIDGAAREVQAAINAARSQLPTSLPSNPTYRKANPADAPVMILAMTARDRQYSQGQMYDYAQTVLAQKLSQLQGVGQVDIGGSSLPAVRVESNPAALARYGIAASDVSAAINANNANRPKGVVELGDRAWQIYANDQSKSAAEYLPLIVAYRNGAAVRLSDVAQVTDSVQDLRNAGSANGQPSVLLIIRTQPDANIIDTVDRITALLPLMRSSIPAAISLDVLMERTSTIRAAVREVERSLLIAMVLVILVVLVFLRSVRAAVIPAVAVPVSLIGTFSVMYLAGFSINNLSLMALTVATGFVVDDAIVVLENTAHHIEDGMPPMQAALVGAREVGFTVLSMSLSLIAVFIPILMMGGIVGRLFREFSVTLSVAVLVSLVVSLTTTPMMCARLLRKKVPDERPNLASRASERAFGGLVSAYRASVGWSLRHPLLIVLILLSTVALNVILYSKIQKGFFPQQDTGRLFGNIRADQAISFQAMRQKLADFVEIVKADPAIEMVTAFTGGGQRNRGFMFIQLKPLEERKIGAEGVVTRLRAKLAKEPGAQLFLAQALDVRAGGRQSDSSYQFTLLSDDLEQLRLWAPRLERALADVPEVADVSSDQEVHGLQTSLIIERDTAARLGLGPKQIDQALNLAFGQAIVSTIYRELNQYRVVLEAAPQYWQSPEGLRDVNLLSPTKGLIPLSQISHWETTNTALAINHQSQFVASTISFNLPEKVSLSKATDAVRATMARIGMPATIHGSFQGTARQFTESLASQPYLVLAALVVIYIVLGILYEDLVHPITILSTLPSAGVGALLALMLFGKELNIIAMIGVILLIGIVKKNAIIMIDLAIELRRQGVEAREAIHEAAVRRFRPIMMTTFAALFGALPLAVAYGYGAELRQPLGISIMGGLILSQLLTLYTTPVVYLYLERARERVSRKTATLKPA